MSELIAAGLNGLPFTWAADGTLMLDNLTTGQQADVLAVYAAHNPALSLPDVDGFKLALIGIFGGDLLAINLLYREYPLFKDFLDSQTWSGVQLILGDAWATGTIATDIYLAIKAALPAASIPVTLSTSTST